MSRRELPVGPSAKMALSTARMGEQICPQCGKPLRAGYRCGCPERWENEGGAPAPDDESPPETPAA